MIRVRIVYDTEGWAYYHRARILQEYAPSDIEITIVPHQKRFVSGSFDVLFDMNYGHVAVVRGELSRRKSKAIFLVSFNNGWPQRRDYFNRVCANAHAVIINNLEFWQRAGSLTGTYHISNGVDRRTFMYRVPMKNRPLRVVWIGSDYHRKLKGYDSLLVPLAARLQGIAETDFRVVDPYGKKHSQVELASWYNDSSVYVVASETEGTPNPALEAASCGCVLVTTRVGNMPELVRHGENGIFVERTLDSLVEGVKKALHQREELSEKMLESIASWDWKDRAEQFYRLFRDLVSDAAPLRRTRGKP